MTDKQIIIDGVDVSKCIYFQKEDDEYTCGAEECNGAIVACRACDNCYYKQLKRKEQECERLKETIEENSYRYAELDADFEQLQKKCERLNADNISLRDRVGKLERAILRRNEELDQLKRQHQADKGLITSIGKQNYQLLQEYDKLKEEKQGLIKDWEEKKNLAYEIACKNEKLKQTLTEIKEIAEKQIPYLDIDKSKTMIEAEYDYVGKIYNLEQRMYTILQKISECEGNDEN